MTDLTSRILWRAIAEQALEVAKAAQAVGCTCEMRSDRPGMTSYDSQCLALTETLSALSISLEKAGDGMTTKTPEQVLALFDDMGTSPMFYEVVTALRQALKDRDAARAAGLQVTKERDAALQGVEIMNTCLNGNDELHKERDSLRAKLAAAESVCDHVTYAFTGADNRFIFMAGEPTEVRELGQAYNAWYDARPQP